MVVPGNGKHYPPVAGVRHHDGGVARNKGSIEYQVDSLTGGNNRFYGRVCLAAEIIAERTRGVDNHFALGVKLRACFRVMSDYAVNEVVGVLGERRYRRVIQ